ncbi:TonB-dependent receptor [Chitinophaga nivalis]|uniref:TonB-dependent receptor n=1 Tax=Chitinophaga nivalis TaxID=2991709 RepID=A0ABT3IPG5_9BACT|nr:TonB-dependent receptor [Chitinophaga nivalis]MCW3464629.1 TonB-dependent receptor [Chitinophaga nivalis]MCW3485680.1 TonB-dependent receptor [Chitinophaga nivalis]
MYLKLLPCIVCMLLCYAFTFAQTQPISGKVTDQTTGAPLEGITIRVVSAPKGTQTTKDGIYALTATASDVLEISAIGYKTQQVHINGRTRIDIQLQPMVAELTQIVLVGSRSGGRAKTETPVPVDVISVNQAGLPSAKMELTSLLNAAAPSFNYNKQSGSDGADQIDLATLRGLGPDQTLVLVNGKRRHQTAFVSVFGTRGRGNSGTDLNAIPEAAIDRVEILRDGASAQYGSDAIAGVINLILKKEVHKLNITAGYAGYYDRKYNPYYNKDLQQYEHGGGIDGNALSIGASYGVPIGKHNGFINFAGNFLTQGKTFRQVTDTNLLHAGGMPINTGRRAHGDGSVTSGGGMVNLEIPIGSSRTTVYAFGGYNYKSSDAYAYTRTFHGFNPSSSAHPDRFPTRPDGSLIFYPDIMKSVPTPGGGRADTIFDPHIQTRISDLSVAAGIKGSTNNNWKWDLSNTFGRNDFHFYGDKTFNASMGAATPTHFDNGGFSFAQNTTNLTFSKEIPGIGAGFNLALGAEYRYENYRIYAGDESSYTNYDPTFFKATGAQGFPGYRPTDAVKANRSNIAGYVDAEWDITTRFLLGGAVRVENYSDFGFTSNYKLAARFKVAPTFNIRGSVSSGYRAPSLQQINYSSQFTNVQGGRITEVKIAPNSNEITQAAGIPALKQEKSLNASLGFSWKPVSGLTITVDGYMVKVKDRIVLSGQFNAGDTTLDAAFLAKLKALHIDNAQFFANAVNTTNTGIDLVIDYQHKWQQQRVRVLFTGNVQHMNLDQINVPDKLNDSYLHRGEFFSEREQHFVLASAPPVKMGLNLEYGVRSFTVGTRLSYYGKIKLLGYGFTGDPAKTGSGLPGDPNLAGTGISPLVALDSDGTLVPEAFNYRGKVVTDLYTSYRITPQISWFLGADNIFNVHPDLGYVPGAKLSAYDGETGGPWDAVQMGFNGIRLFTKVSLTF